MERLDDWVDANPPTPDRSFSGRRTGKLFVAVLLGAILGAIPLALLDLGLQWAEHAQRNQQKEEQLREQWLGLEKAAREGKTNKATRRLFGLDDLPPAPQGQAEKKPK